MPSLDTLHPVHSFVSRALRDLELGVEAHPMPAPAKAPYPFVVFDFTPSGDLRHKSGMAWAPGELIVRLVSERHPAPTREQVQTLAAIDSLDGAYGDAFGARVTLVRAGAFALPPYVRSEGAQQVIEEAGVRFSVRVEPIEERG